MNGGNQGTSNVLGSRETAGEAAVAGRRSRSLVAVGIAATLSLATVGFAIGHDSSVLKPRTHSGQAWLSTTSLGAVSQVDGLSGTAGAQVTIDNSAGHKLAVTQSGDLVLVRDTVTGEVTVIDTTHLVTGAHLNPGPRTSVLAGGGSAYLVDAGAGLVQKVDPTSLAAIGTAVQLPGSLGASIVDGTGTLWAPVETDGTVVPIVGGARGGAIPVAKAADDMVMALAGGTPVAVDRTAGVLTTLTRTGAGPAINMPKALGAGSNLQVANADSAQPLPLLRTGVGAALILVNLDSRKPFSVDLPPGVAGDDLQSPLQAGSRTYIPDFTTGSALVWDSGKQRWWSNPVPVLSGPGSFETEVVDGVAYFNDPSTGNAVSVTSDGQEHQIQKTGPDVPTAAPSATSSTSVPRPGQTSKTAPNNGATSRNSSARPNPSSTGPTKAPVNTHPSPTTPTPTQPTPTPTKSTPPPPPPTTSSTPPPGPPAPPQLQNLRATLGGSGQVVLSWDQVPNPGAIARIIVQPNVGSLSWTPGSTTATISGLACDTNYTFTLTTENSAGVQSSPATAPPTYACVSPAAPPPAPATSPTIDGKVENVSWQAVPGATSYIVIARQRMVGNSFADPNPHQVTATGTSVQVGNLWMGQTYVFTVISVNAGGNSGESAGTSGIPGYGPGTQWQNGKVDMTKFRTPPHYRACNPSATSGSSVCNTWIQATPTSWTGTYPGQNINALNQGTTVYVVCGKVGSQVRADTGGLSSDWLLVVGNTNIGWILDAWVPTVNTATLPTCNF